MARTTGESDPWSISARSLERSVDHLTTVLASIDMHMEGLERAGVHDHSLLTRLSNEVGRRVTATVEKYVGGLSKPMSTAIYLALRRKAFEMHRNVIRHDFLAADLLICRLMRVCPLDGGDAGGNMTYNMLALCQASVAGQM
jgi:hypothetical protein